ncbi:P-loop containing nucleoside triphosphate hydrolase protein [Apodospora peruviana]|uniref:P-loop containing nucleoside triphosphate hydrolase protein n=1 Tax=Apodospora peruviana TaxID=516989 RepID=A0AAE0IRC1_9PEZI|nr:P-loop containing nucleoside triphosphate hydrolase protein [Apodospora peruviana]
MGQGPSKPAPSNAAGTENGDAPSVNTTQSVPDIRPEDIVIAVMGLTGVGKSTFISHFCNTAVVGDDLESCTNTLSIHSANVDGTDVYLIDTPGFDDTNRTDTDVLREIASWLERSYDADIKLAGIVYLHRIQDNRVGGSGVKNIHMFRELCGPNGLSSVVLATTMWDALPKDKAEEREAELKTKEEFWGGLVQHGCAVLRQDDGAASAAKIIQHIQAQRRPITLQIQEEIVIDGKELHETAAGEVLKAGLEEQQRMYAEKTALLEAQLAKIAAELQSLQAEQAAREEQAREEREREQRDIEKREMGRESEINDLKLELRGLKEDLESTKVKQERTDAEYRKFTSKRWPWDRCTIM